MPFAIDLKDPRVELASRLSRRGRLPAGSSKSTAAAGDYTLSIDGDDLGTFSADKLDKALVELVGGEGAEVVAIDREGVVARRQAVDFEELAGPGSRPRRRIARRVEPGDP